MTRSIAVSVAAALFLGTGAGVAAPPGAEGQAGGRGQAVGAAVPYSVGRALPEKAAGWARGPKVTLFGPSSLWEHINGAAEQYLAFEFQELATAVYTRAAGGTATVEIYRMAGPVHAYGIYAQEVSPSAARVAIGVEGRAGKTSLKYWTGDFYVKVVSPSSGAAPQEEIVALARAVAAGLGAPGKPPAQLGWFPPDGLVADSIKFVPADALGQSMFANALEAKYAGAPEASTLVIVPFAGAEAARAALAKYEAFLGGAAKGAKPLTAPADGGILAQDGYYGRIVAIRSGATLVISLGAATEAAATARVFDAVRRLPAAPGPKGKGGTP